MSADNGEHTHLPRENLIRAFGSGVEIRSADEEKDGMPTLFGHFAVFDRWAEIDSAFEGHFLERIAPGAFQKTFRDQRRDMRVLFQHGMDPVAGDKPLGPIETLEEDDIGARYEVPLFDTSYNRDLIPALEAGQLGASFRFRVTREEIDDEPEPREENPEGLQERTIKEMQVFEFGPVTFPAYSEATAGVRSLRPADLHVALNELTVEEETEEAPDVGGAAGTAPRRASRPRRPYLRRAKYTIPRRGRGDEPKWLIPNR